MVCKYKTKDKYISLFPNRPSVTSSKTSFCELRVNICIVTARRIVVIVRFGDSGLSFLPLFIKRILLDLKS